MRMPVGHPPSRRYLSVVIEGDGYVWIFLVVGSLMDNGIFSLTEENRALFLSILCPGKECDRERDDDNQGSE